MPMFPVTGATTAGHSTFAERAARHVVEAEHTFLEWKDRYDRVSEQISEAMADHDPRRVAELRCERAWVQLHLRDLWGPWHREYQRWDYWMRDDVAAAQRVAGTLGQQLGDSKLPERLFAPYPRLAALAGMVG